MTITRSIGRLSFYIVLAAFSALIIRQDAGMIVSGRKFIESSYTEWTQLVYITLTFLILFLTGKRFTQLRPASYLVGGGFVVVLIRELDAYLDAIYHGVWFPFALIVMAVTLYSAFRQRHHLRESIERFMATPAFGLFVAGGLGIFVFSRLFGAKVMWATVFQVDVLEPGSPIRWVKNAVEEGSELFGYCLVLCGAIELLSYAFRHLGPDVPER